MPKLNRDFRFALRDYFNSLSNQACQAYLQRCGVTQSYARTQLIRQRTAPSRIPTKGLIYALADESEGQVSRLQALFYYYPEINDGLDTIVEAGQMINVRQERSRLPDYFYGLSDEAKSDYVQRAGSTLQYIRSYLVRRRATPGGVPNKSLLLSLADESDGQVSRFQVLFYYYSEIDKDLLALLQSVGAR